MTQLTERNHALMLAALRYYADPSNWKHDAGPLPELYAVAVLQVVAPEPAPVAEPRTFFAWGADGEAVGDGYETAEAAAAAFWRERLFTTPNPPAYVEVVEAHYATPDRYTSDLGQLVADHISSGIHDDAGEWADYLPGAVESHNGTLQALIEPAVRAWLTTITGPRLNYWLGGATSSHPRPEALQDE